MAIQVFATDTTGVATYKQVTAGGQLVKTIAPGDSITATIFNRADEPQGDPVDASGDGAGNWSAKFRWPTTPGAYYVQFDVSVGGDVDRVTADFVAQARVIG